MKENLRVIVRDNSTTSKVEVSKKMNTAEMLFFLEELFSPCLTKIFLYSFESILYNLLQMLADMNYRFTWQEAEEQGYIATCILQLVLHLILCWKLHTLQHTGIQLLIPLSYQCKSNWVIHFKKSILLQLFLIKCYNSWNIHLIIHMCIPKQNNLVRKACGTILLLFYLLEELSVQQCW